MLVYWLFRLGSALSSWLPLELGYRIADLVAAAAYHLFPRRRANVRANLRHALGPDLNEARLEQLARGVFRTAIKNYFEMLRMGRFDREQVQARTRVHGLEHLEAALAVGRGVILFTAHFGSFESAAQILAVKGFKVIVPAEPIKPVALFEFVSRLRATHGHQMIAAERGIVRSLVKALRRNEIVGFVVDRDAIGGGIPFELFGARTALQPAAVSLARRGRCPVVSAFAVRQPDNTSDVFIEPALTMQVTEDEEADLQANMRSLIAVCERYIRQYPDQWVALVPVWPTGKDDYVESEVQAKPREPVGQSRSTHS